jgi:hypothetical protein
MDTDYLTPMAYECILLGDKASDVLKAELGAAASLFDNEEDYLHGILKHVNEIERDPEGYLDEWNLLLDIEIRLFKANLRELKKHIKRTIATPFEERGELINWDERGVNDRKNHLRRTNRR